MVLCSKFPEIAGSVSEGSARVEDNEVEHE